MYLENPDICASNTDCPHLKDHPEMFGDGYCDRELNNPECNYDDGDCCSSTRLDWRKNCGNVCQCLDPNDSSRCKIDQFEDLVGNGVCDSELQNLECGFDFDDCCKYHAKYAGDGKCQSDMNNAECGYDGGDCCDKEKLGNGYCDMKMNNVVCNYDGGDCCSSSRPDWWKNCGNDCQCLDPNDSPKPQSCKSENFEELAGNDECNEELNNPECRYDNGDC